MPRCYRKRSVRPCNLRGNVEQCQQRCQSPNSSNYVLTLARPLRSGAPLLRPLMERISALKLESTMPSSFSARGRAGAKGGLLGSLQVLRKSSRLSCGRPNPNCCRPCLLCLRCLLRLQLQRVTAPHRLSSPQLSAAIFQWSHV